VLLIVLVEHMLFEINNYMADLLAVPLMLEATLLVMGPREAGNERVRMIRIALLCGASVAFKLTNIATIIPIALAYAYFILRQKEWWRGMIVSLPLSLLAFVAPLAPFSFYIYRETGSPVFPVFNGIFKSPLWFAHSGWDGRWGALGLKETLAWPVLMTFKPERLSELAVYSGRISIGFVVSLLALLLIRRDARIATLSFIVLLGSLLWSAMIGYIRYALFLEVVAGVLVLALAATLVRETLRLPRALKFTTAAVLCLALVVQVIFACVYTYGYEWSMRGNFFQNPGVFLSETKYLLRDHSLRKFLSAEDREMYSNVDVWIDSTMRANGIEVMLNRRAPIIGIRSEEYFVTPASLERFERALAAVEGKRMYTLCFAEDYNEVIERLKRRGLVAGQTRQVKIPYYTPNNQLSMFFIEVVRASPQLNYPR
jgi:hypothetical protein